MRWYPNNNHTIAMYNGLDLYTVVEFVTNDYFVRIVILNNEETMVFRFPLEWFQPDRRE